MIANNPSEMLSLGTFVTTDGRKFDLNGRIYNMRPSFNYWMLSVDAYHSEQGHLPFTVCLDKLTSPTFEAAKRLAAGLPLNEVCGLLNVSDEYGRPMCIRTGPGYSLV